MPSSAVKKTQKSRNKKVLVLHGPNLNLLGTREPKVYGRETLAEINRRLSGTARSAGVDLDCFQSNQIGRAHV